MKPLICAILSLLFFFTATAQTYVLQAGRQYLMVNQDGSVRLDSRSSTQLYLGLEGRIYTKDHNLYLATDFDRNRLVHFTPSDAKADKLIFEDNPSGSGRFITKRFIEGTLYLVVSGTQLKWRKSRSEGIPVLLLRQTTTNETGRTSASRERSREEIGAAQKRQQDAAAAAAEKKRQEGNRVKPPKQGTGSINVELKNFGTNCTIYYAMLWSPSDMSFDTLQQTFSANCQTIFLDLKDGTYVVDLYAKSTFELGYLCQGCPTGLVSKNKVTIINGNKREVYFESKSE
jgi:hypothetical protein